MNRRILLGFIPLILSLLACQPMIVVGWNEFFFIFIIVAILIGPPVYRLVRRIENRLRQNNKDKTNNSK